jgi:hypothetical protein
VFDNAGDSVCKSAKMFIWVSCGSWVVGNTTVLQETRFHYAIFGEGIVTHIQEFDDLKKYFKEYLEGEEAEKAGLNA